MASGTVVRARIDGQVKERAAKVLADMGLSISHAIRLLLVRVAAEKALPRDQGAKCGDACGDVGPRKGGGQVFRQRGRADGRSECGGLSALPHSNAIIAHCRPAIADHALVVQIRRMFRPIFPSCPRKWASRASSVIPAVLGPRFRGGDEEGPICC
jgi:DNA-damage-inducible protein J